MPSPVIAIKKTGLVSSVGLSAPASCAAIRAKATNPSETGFLDSRSRPIMAHQVPFERGWRGRTRLVKLAAMAIVECLADLPRAEWPAIPLLLCVAERARPGRLAGLDDQLVSEIEQEIGTGFAPASGVIAGGRVGVCIALVQARKLIHEQNAPLALIAAADSLLTWPTLRVFDIAGRLLADGNSNGFMPGEAGGAILVGRREHSSELLCGGVGYGLEKAWIDSGLPLRGDGLVAAIKAALDAAGCTFSDVDYRMTDLSGEQYYFKEAALALGRIRHARAGELELWHPAECIGECGAAAGLAMVALADAAHRRAYAPGSRLLVHAGNDGGQRAAAVLFCGGLP